MLFIFSESEWLEENISMMPAVRGDGMRGLAVFISDIRNCKSKEAEIKRINKELANIRWFHEFLFTMLFFSYDNILVFTRFFKLKISGPNSKETNPKMATKRKNTFANYYSFFCWVMTLTLVIWKPLIY